MRDHPVSFSVDSPILKFLFRFLPAFRGHIPLLTFVARLLPACKSAQMTVGDSTFCMDASYSTHMSCLRLGTYEPLETEAVLQTLAPGDNFLDIGANWGYFSALASHCVGSQGTICAVEANPTTFARMLVMLRESGVANVLPFNFAIHDKDGQRLNFVAPIIGSDAFGHLGTNKWQVGTQRVLSTSLDMLWRRMGSQRFKMAKIDVEGAEPLVIKGGKACLSQGVMESVLVEINKWTEDRCGVPYHVCYELVADCGFAFAYRPTEHGYVQIALETDPLPFNTTILFKRTPLTARVD